MKFSIQSVYAWYRDLLRNPKYRWWVILGTIVYIISPIDIAPDFIPIVGEIDDVLLLTLLVTEVSGLVIEGWKARKGVATNNPNTSEDSTSTASTVDVDAVSVK
ncbi:MAG: YkvA family protein [Aulosira sp. ZfuVER01]|nr:YkvA family protein [Aulosira sp. ZfuVER01]MDZ8002279.1 YkvA family protein [Aulosira sp. DedVER01a]MDZ8052717.1 YkvA family protein [Aulosira sp. ZfuCHP01]